MIKLYREEFLNYYSKSESYYDFFDKEKHDGLFNDENQIVFVNDIAKSEKGIIYQHSKQKDLFLLFNDGVLSFLEIYEYSSYIIRQSYLFIFGWSTLIEIDLTTFKVTEIKDLR